MATLSDTGNTFELTPVVPSLDGPPDAYTVRIWSYDALIFDRQFNVAGWQAGHSEVYKMGKAFALSRRVLDATVPLSLWNEASTDPADCLPLQVWLSVLWLEVVVSGSTFSFRGKTTHDMTARFYVWTGPHGDYEPDEPPTQPLPTYAACELYVDVDKAVAFGEALVAECRTAQRLRKELGIEHYDDHLDFQPR